MALDSKTQNDLKAKHPLAACPHCGSISAPEFTTACDVGTCSADSESCPNFITDDECDCKAHYVVCNAKKGGCGAASGWGSDEEVAARLWNSRIYSPHGDCCKCPDEIDLTCPYAGDPDGCYNRELGARVREAFRQRRDA